MKKYILFSIVVLAVVFMNGCDLNPIPFNVPISIDVVLNTNTSSASDEGTVNLADYEDLTEDVNNVTFIEAAFRVKSVSNTSLRGNITVTIQNNSGFFYTETLTNVVAADYIQNPYVLQLTGAQVQALNAYLGTISDQVFTGSVAVSNISGGNPPYSMVGAIDFVLEAETEL